MKIENSEINAADYAKLVLKMLVKRDAEAEADIERMSQLSHDYQQLLVLHADIEKLHAQVREVAARICVNRVNTDLLALMQVSSDALHAQLQASTNVLHAHM